jgi:NAD(P)-dependent dehydrogenase (short-subunit alcohol dehydrogenase family)
VLLTDLNVEGAEAAAREIDLEVGRGTAFATRHDVTSEADWTTAIALASETLGGLSRPCKKCRHRTARIGRGLIPRKVATRYEYQRRQRVHRL